MLQIFNVDENHHFLTYSAKNSAEISSFYDFFQSIQISEGELTLWRHSDVIWSSVVIILVSMNRGGPYQYTGSKYRSCIRCSVYKSREGIVTTPSPSEDVLQKVAKRTRVKGPLGDKGTILVHKTNITMISFPKLVTMAIFQTFKQKVNVNDPKWPTGDIWPDTCSWCNMFDSTQGLLCPIPMAIHRKHSRLMIWEPPCSRFHEFPQKLIHVFG